MKMRHEVLRDQTALSKDFVGLCGLRKIVRLNQKSLWRLNQRVGS